MQENGKDAVHPLALQVTKSDLAFGWFCFNALLELGQPVVSLFSRDMQAVCAVSLPSIDGVLAKVFTLFFAVNILSYRFTHQPMRGALASFGKTFYAEFNVIIDFDRDRANASSSHGKLQAGIFR